MEIFDERFKVSFFLGRQDLKARMRKETGRKIIGGNNGECRAWPHGGSPRELLVFEQGRVPSVLLFASHGIPSYDLTLANLFTRFTSESMVPHSQLGTRS